jgi:hypothetical protein
MLIEGIIVDIKSAFREWGSKTQNVENTGLTRASDSPIRREGRSTLRDAN